MKINNVDMTPFLAIAKYNTGLTPVYARRFVDTDGVEHVTIQRWRATLSDVKLKILTNAQALQLGEILSQSPMTVEYKHGSLGTVTQEMILQDDIGNSYLPSITTSDY